MLVCVLLKCVCARVHVCVRESERMTQRRCARWQVDNMYSALRPDVDGLGKAADLWMLAVDPLRRGQRIAQQLTAIALAHAHASGAFALARSHTRDPMPPARPLALAGMVTCARASRRVQDVLLQLRHARP